MAGLRYVSTRGHAPAADFETVLLTGLAADGGLFVPETLPALSAPVWAGLAGRSFADLGAAVVAPFVDDPAAAAAALGDVARRFAHPAVTPLVQTGPGDFILELFHGPTLAFKDVAMQWLAPLFVSALGRQGRAMTIVAATSGDTGGAAVEALAGRAGIGLCVLHPHERVSPVQRRFMTCSGADNILNLAVRGTFDDCQHIVKQMFADATFAAEIGLGAVNSINWARIVAQAVYFASAALTLGSASRPVAFSVPTGNFGDIFAGFLARAMGAPVGRLIIATNANDILHRTLDTGVYAPRGVIATTSPSMDIQVSSNFERLIFVLSGGDAAMVRRLMADLAETGAFTLPGPVHAALRAGFASAAIAEATVESEISRHWAEMRQLLDPHTAVGVAAAQAARHGGLDGPIVTLATAHAAKFPEAVAAATGETPALPDRIGAALRAPEVFEVVTADLAAIKTRVRAAFGQNGAGRRP